MQLDDFDYILPPELIAQHPPEERGASRLLHIDVPEKALRDTAFRALPALLAPGDVLVFNNTRVIKARLRGTKATGGKVEVLVERVLAGGEVLAQVSASHSPQAGAVLTLGPGLQVEVVGREGTFFRLRFPEGEPVLTRLERHGELPLPPYISRAPETEDEGRYQTVYASRPGAVAAPTAGLHFTEEILQALRQRGVKTCEITLHVGAGTFQPVRVDDISRHRMHSEWYEVPEPVVETVREAKRAGGRVVAVGTTSVRALEAASRSGELRPCTGDTELFITPGFEFHAIDAMITNFHLPKSTLLMLVSAFGGIDLMRRAYAHAVAQSYRFFSYGDAMLIDRNGRLSP
jgi:S-adenosylmethionine:tRNA ribosyltransferase-isomerase